MYRTASWVGLLAAGALAGCGSSSSSSSGGASPAGSSAGGAGATVTVAETEYKIRPAADRVAGTGAITIVVHNNGKIVHALAIKTPQGVEQTPAIQPGGSATLTFHITQTGSYTFYCPIDHHRKLGMVGTLTVRKGGPSSGGAPIGPTTSSSTSSVHGGY